jgi:hypothetical protein
VVGAGYSVSFGAVELGGALMLGTMGTTAFGSGGGAAVGGAGSSVKGAGCTVPDIEAGDVDVESDVVSVASFADIPRDAAPVVPLAPSPSTQTPFWHTNDGPG